MSPILNMLNLPPSFSPPRDEIFESSCRKIPSHPSCIKLSTVILREKKIILLLCQHLESSLIGKTKEQCNCMFKHFNSALPYGINIQLRLNSKNSLWGKSWKDQPSPVLDIQGKNCVGLKAHSLTKLLDSERLSLNYLMRYMCWLNRLNMMVHTQVFREIIYSQKTCKVFFVTRASWDKSKENRAAARHFILPNTITQS